MALLVDVAEIPAAVVAIPDVFCGGFRIFVITGIQILAFDHNLAVICDLDLRPRHRTARGLRSDFTGARNRNDPHFRAAVKQLYFDAQGQKKPDDLGTDGPAGGIDHFGP